MVNNSIKAVLLVIILVLAYFVYESILTPVRFKKDVDRRSEAVINHLKDIRTVEMTFKSMYGKYSKSFDTLIDFVNTSEIPVVKMIPDPTDTTFTKTIRDTLGYRSVRDSLFGLRENFNPNNLKFIPFTKGKIFEINAGVIEKGGVKVNVFEVKAPYAEFLKDLDHQMVINLIAGREQLERYAGIKVGSMAEASTDGNWE